MRVYSPPSTWEHQWTWSLFSSRNLRVSLILNSLSCDHIISLGGDPALCPLTTESSKCINCVIVIDQPEVTAPHHPPSSQAVCSYCSLKKKNEREERQQSKSSNKQHKRFIPEGQRLTGLIAPGVWGKPVRFRKPTGKNWVQTNCLLQREYYVGEYGNNYVLRACFTFCAFPPTRDTRTARVAE